MNKIPVILDTDIGGDIDDTWALMMVLQCPELDLKLVTTDAGDTVYRSRLAAKLLEAVGRTDVPVGTGIRFADSGAAGLQEAWVGDYALSDYPGVVHEDGVGAIIHTILTSPEPVTLICIGPVPNIAAALGREPRIAGNARFVGMHGSVRRGYGNGSPPCPEANVRSGVEALQRVFAAPWDITLTPLDTCARVRLTGEKYRTVRDRDEPLARAIIENYRIWAPIVPWMKQKPNPEVASTTLFDTVAVYLAFSEDLLVMEHIGLRVTDDGMTVEDSAARPVNCAMDWKDLGAFEDLLVERLTGEVCSSLPVLG